MPHLRVHIVVGCREVADTEKLLGGSPACHFHALHQSLMPLLCLSPLACRLGVNLSGLLLPAGVALAFAAKDLSHNFLAGFFLFAVQPFRLGDRIAVHSQAAAGVSAGPSPPGSPWFEGICEKVDLR